MTTTFAGTYLEQMSAWTTPANDPDGDHATFLTALAQTVEETFGLVMDQGDDPDAASWVPGWGSLLDVDACPAKYLPYLAQFVGAVIPVGTSPAHARAMIRSESGMQRGTAAAITAAATRNLTGTQSVVLQERTAADGSADAYHFLLLVRPEELFWNLVPNPSFEYDTVGAAPAVWAVTLGAFNTAGTSLSTRNTQAHSGSQSAELVTPATVNAGCYVPLTGTFTAGVAYSASVWLRLAGGTSPTMEAVLGVAGDQAYSSVVTIFPTWVQLTVSWTPTSTHASGVQLAVVSPAGLAADVFIDAALVVELGVLPSYADGDQAGYGWSGTPGNSPTTSITALSAAVDAVRPAGVRWTLVQSDAPLLNQYTRLMSAVTRTLAAAQLSDVT